MGLFDLLLQPFSLPYLHPPKDTLLGISYPSAFYPLTG